MSIFDFPIDIFNVAINLISVLTPIALVAKLIIDQKDAKQARERLIKAERIAFSVTSDADFNELEAKLPGSGSGLGAKALQRHPHADASNAAKLSDLYSKQIEKYQTDTQARASWSFFFAVFSMIGGLGFVVWGGSKLIESPGWEHVTGATAIAAIGGGIGAYIAKTFLDVHRLSLSQLNHYFRQPVVNAHVLTGQRLAEHLTDQAARERGYELLLQRVADLIREEIVPGAVWIEPKSSAQKIEDSTKEPNRGVDRE